MYDVSLSILLYFVSSIQLFSKSVAQTCLKLLKIPINLKLNLQRRLVPCKTIFLFTPMWEQINKKFEKKFKGGVQKWFRSHLYLYTQNYYTLIFPPTF